MSVFSDTAAVESVLFTTGELVVAPAEEPPALLPLLLPGLVVPVEAYW